ncbi:hypothetical protein C6501_06875 [Candidatus Poribacteria bacterium]|nr:MAG: hypothetical protein C6501_06875 [Candidatus Poribacteria bacterium]
MYERKNDLTLRAIPDIRPLYILPKEPLIKEVLIPCFQFANYVDCMMGFFSSKILVSLAPGLATFINSTAGNLRLVISPYLSSEDQNAIKEGISSAEEIAHDFLESVIFTEDFVAQHTLKCLSWMLRGRRLEIRIALMKNGLFHPKVWIFGEGDDIIAAHGSSNMTDAGIQKNIEQISVSKSWEGVSHYYITDKFSNHFKQLWADEDDSCTIISMPNAIKEKILKTYSSDTPPTEADIQEFYDKTTNSIDESQGTYDFTKSTRPTFSIPSKLKFEEGPFEHQGRAVNAWCEAGYQGVLEMATGSGKTITAMICAHRLYEEQKPLLIIVAAPYKPLIQQWCDEIVPFGLKAINLTEAKGAKGRAQELSRIKRRFRNRTNDIEIVVVSHKTLCKSEFKTKLKKFDCKTMLIADEVHNLGSEGFITEPPTFFDYKLGLSATPIRQYDKEGTEKIFEFFGNIVFAFTLEEAIGRCLVDYEYYVHPVKLTDEEMEKWYEITEKIRQNSWRQESNKSDEYLNKLLRDRRAILENAENKIAALEKVLMQENLSKLRYTLIYASDKNPQQLENVNALLNKYGMLFRQVTCEETGIPDKTRKIIQDFQEGTIGIITAKRVLDEGVNIPEIEKAFILASTTVERQWVQRRGRILRTCSNTGKTHSEIHDFVALPPDLDNIDDSTHPLIRSELIRIETFAKLAMNYGRPNGPLKIIDRLVEIIYG